MKMLMWLWLCKILVNFCRVLSHSIIGYHQSFKQFYGLIIINWLERFLASYVMSTASLYLQQSKSVIIFHILFIHLSQTNILINWSWYLFFKIGANTNYQFNDALQLIYLSLFLLIESSVSCTKLWLLIYGTKLTLRDIYKCFLSYCSVERILLVVWWIK